MYDNKSKIQKIKSEDMISVTCAACYKYHRRCQHNYYHHDHLGKQVQSNLKYQQMKGNKSCFSILPSSKSTFSSYVLLTVIYSMILLVPNAVIVECTVLEEFGQTLQRNLGNVEIEDISNEYNRGGAQRKGRQFQDDAFVAPNLNPFNLQPQTPQPSFRDISGGGNGGGGFATYGNQLQSVSLLELLLNIDIFLNF